MSYFVFFLVPWGKEKCNSWRLRLANICILQARPVQRLFNFTCLLPENLKKQYSDTMRQNLKEDGNHEPESSHVWVMIRQILLIWDSRWTLWGKHSCGTLLQATLCKTLLRDTLVRCSWYDTLAGHSWYDTLVDTLVGHSHWRLLLWHSCRTLLVGTLIWHSGYDTLARHSWYDTLVGQSVF